VIVSVCSRSSTAPVGHVGWQKLCNLLFLRLLLLLRAAGQIDDWSQLVADLCC